MDVNVLITKCLKRLDDDEMKHLRTMNTGNNLK